VAEKGCGGNLLEGFKGRLDAAGVSDVVMLTIA